MWAVACLISLVLSLSNTIGYYKCSGEQKKKFSSYIFSKGKDLIPTLLGTGNSQK